MFDINHMTIKLIIHISTGKYKEDIKRLNKGKNSEGRMVVRTLGINVSQETKTYSSQPYSY